MNRYQRLLIRRATRTLQNDLPLPVDLIADLLSEGIDVDELTRKIA